MNNTSKNYKTNGGDVLVIGGELRVESGKVTQNGKNIDFDALKNQKVLFDFTTEESKQSYIPQFKKYESNPVYTADQSPAPSVYWMQIKRMDYYFENPLGKYYMFYSTDHDSGPGGIYLAYSNTPKGPWTSYGLIFRDPKRGQTETPRVEFNEYLDKWQMFYHNNGGLGRGQTTTFATSDDCLTWTPSNEIVVDPAEFEFPGDAHTGYFSPFRINGNWFAYHLMGGQDFPHCGISYSLNGEDWMIDPRPLSYSFDATQDPTRKIGWNTSAVFNWKGQLYWVGYISNFVSGGVEKDGKIGMGILNSDMRSFRSPVQEILAPSQDWENTDIKCVYAFVDDGTLYLYYQLGDKIGVATAE